VLNVNIYIRQEMTLWRDGEEKKEGGGELGNQGSSFIQWVGQEGRGSSKLCSGIPDLDRKSFIRSFILKARHIN